MPTPRSHATPTCDDCSASALVEAEAWLVLVANARHYTYRLRVASRAVVDDGWLDVWLFASGPGTLVAGQVVGLLRGRPGRCRGVCHLRARRLRIESDPPVFVHVDGDPAGRTSVDIGIIPRALSVMAPASGSTAE